MNFPHRENKTKQIFILSFWSIRRKEVIKWYHYYFFERETFLKIKLKHDPNVLQNFYKTKIKSFFVAERNQKQI